jgi:hypothetical protein
MRTIRTELPDGRYAVVVTLNRRHAVIILCAFALLIGYGVGVVLVLCGVL